MPVPLRAPTSARAEPARARGPCVRLVQGTRAPGMADFAEPHPAARTPYWPAMPIHLLLPACHPTTCNPTTCNPHVTCRVPVTLTLHRHMAPCVILAAMLPPTRGLPSPGPQAWAIVGLYKSAFDPVALVKDSDELLVVAYPSFNPRGGCGGLGGWGVGSGQSGVGCGEWRVGIHGCDAGRRLDRGCDRNRSGARAAPRVYACGLRQLLLPLHQRLVLTGQLNLLLCSSGAALRGGKRCCGLPGSLQLHPWCYAATPALRPSLALRLAHAQPHAQPHVHAYRGAERCLRAAHARGGGPQDAHRHFQRWVTYRALRPTPMHGCKWLTSG